MDITINIRHQPNQGESAHSRHDVAIQSLLAAPGFTNDTVSNSNCILEFADDDPLDTGCSNLTPLCVSGIKATAVYAPRFPDLPDLAMYDDSLVLRVDPKRVHYTTLITSALAVVIGEFSPYRCDVFLDEDLMLDDFHRAVYLTTKERIDHDARRFVSRLNPVNYFDRELCRRAFDNTPESITEILKGMVERVELVNDGVLIVITSEAIGRAQIEAIDPAIRPLVDRSRRP